MVRTTLFAVMLLTAAGVPDRAAAGSSTTAAALATVPAPTGDRYESDWSYRIRPWKRESVVSVTVTAAGLGDDKRDVAGDPLPCTGFRPGTKQIKEFVSRAKRVSHQSFVHQTDWSACHATGRLTLRSGTVAEWMVQRLGAGYLTINGQRYYFDCDKCKWVGTM